MRNAYIGVAIAVVAIAALLIFGDFGGDGDETSPPEQAPAEDATAPAEGKSPEPADVADAVPEPADAVEAPPETDDVAEAAPEPTDDAEAAPEPANVTEAPPEPTDDAEAAPEPANVTEAPPEPTDDAEAAPEPADVADAVPEPADAAEAPPEPADVAEAPSEPAEIAELSPEPAEIAAAPEETEFGAAGAVEASPEAPSFDVVRIDRRGKAVIAGRAAPGAEVSVRSGDDLLGSTTADGRGEWVLLPDRPLPSGPSALSLASKLPDTAAVESESVLVVDVPKATVAKVAPSAETGAVLTPREGASTVAPRTSESLAVLVPRNDGGASTVLQGPEDAGVGVVGAALRLDTVDYDTAGNLVLSGRGEPGTYIRAFVDDEAVGVVEVAEGRWRLAPEAAVAPGQHALRIEQISEAGVVMAELSLPFSRAGPDELSLAEGQVVVQPGNSLWRIARRTYGQGIRYTMIFEANRDQINDPDLIFPGQIFALPQSN